MSRAQYNRIKVPREVLGGTAPLALERVGKTQGQGVLHILDETKRRLEALLRHEDRAVESISGAGANPKMRGIRVALEALEIDEGALLAHGNPRVVYTIPQVDNYRRYLLGQDDAPAWRHPQAPPGETVGRLSGWWIDRWLSRRIDRPGVLDAVAGRQLAHGCAHGALVEVPPEDEDEGPRSLFPGW